MTISKRRKEKRRALHYTKLAVEFVLEGGDPSWLPDKSYGNLSILRTRLDELKRFGAYSTGYGPKWIKER